MALSAEERDLLDLQTDLLRQAQEAMASGNALNELMIPIMLEEAGYTAEYGDVQVANPKYEKLKGQLKDWEAELARLTKKGSFLGGEDRQHAQKRIQEIKANLKKTPQYLTERQITGLTAIESPAEDLRGENEQLLLEQQNAALRGELPVNPALLADLDQQEEELRASLLENLGEGYETSTPGIEALAEFSESRSALEEAARRDDIATMGGLANQMGGFLESLSGARSSRAMGAAGIPIMGASNLMQIANSYSGPMQYMQNNRMMDFQMQQANNAPGLFESLLTQGAGSAMTFGLGKLFDVF